MKRWIIAVACLFLCLASRAEEYRIWTDRSGNTLEARLIYKSEQQIELRDKKGRIHTINPQKLSDGDQHYLYPPLPSPTLPPDPVKYRLTPLYTSRQVPTNQHSQTESAAVSFAYEFTFKVERLAEEAPLQGLRGAMFIMGTDPDGTLAVIEKTEAPVEMDGDREGRVRGVDFELIQTEDENRKWIKGTNYRGYLVVLYAKDRTVLEKQSSHRFLERDIDKTFSLNADDRFNEQCALVAAGTF